MKKLILALALVSLLTTKSAYAVENYDRGYITVNFESTKELDPTEAKVSFSIITEGKDSKTAGSLNETQSNKVIEETKAILNLQAGESIKTTAYYVMPKYDYKDGTSKIIGYRATNTLLVSVKDLEKTGDVISTVLSNGADSISNVDFSVSKADSECNSLIVDATKNAKTRAAVIAKAMGTNVASVKSINARCSANSNNHTNYRTMSVKNSMDGTMNTSSPVEIGKTELRAIIEAEFYVN